MVLHVIGAFRNAPWITRERVTAVAWMLLAAYSGAVCVVILRGNGAVDFRSFWAASSLALGGNPAGAYDPAQYLALEPADGRVSLFFYPPPYLLLCLPLALLPLWSAAVAWMAGTWALLAAAARPLLPRGTAAIAAAFPAAWISAGNGQNGCLTAAVLILAARLLDARPFLAGASLGVLVIKPQIALGFAVTLVAARRWRAIAGAILSSTTVCSVSLLILGPETWLAFVHQSRVAAAVMVSGIETPVNLAGVAGAALLAGASARTALAVQAAVAAASCLCAWRVARRPLDGLALGALGCALTPLCAPWLHYYDLTVLALPMLWLVSHRAFQPWEKLILAAAYLSPIVGHQVAVATGICIGPWACAAMFVAVCIRISSAAASRAPQFQA